MTQTRIPRRDFVRLSAAAVGAAFLTPQGLLAQATPDLRIEMDGLITFVRPKTSTGPWRALLMDTTKLQHAHVDRHWPILRIRRAVIDQTVTKQPTPLPKPAPQPSGGEWQWDLTDTEVYVIRGSSEVSGGLSTEMTTRRRNGNGSYVSKCTTDTAEHSDVSWLADLKACCGGGTIKSDHVSGSLAGGMIASRVILGGGKLTCAHSAIGANKNYVFRVNANYEQNFADVVRCDIQASGQPFVLRLKRGTTTTDIAFKTTQPTVVAHIANYVADGHVGGDPKAPIEHFAAYYELLDPAPTYDPIPRFVSDCTGAHPPAGGPAPGGAAHRPNPGDPPAYCPPGAGDEP